MGKRKNSAFAEPRPSGRGHAWQRIPATATLIAGLLAPGMHAADDTRKPRKPSKQQATAVETVIDTQIRNAINAGEGDLVVRALRQKVVEQPSNIEARLALGACYERRRAPELAIEHYRVAALEYGSEVAASRLAQTLDGLGESEQALQVLVQFCDSHPDSSSRILSELGILEDEMANQTMGEHYHRRALAAALTEGASGQDALHNNLGYNLIAQKKFSEAEEQLRVALELNPRSETARGNLALALSSPPAATAAQVNEAILQWESLSGPAAAHNNLAAVYLEQGRYSEARRELERALQYDRASGPALKNLETLSALDGKPAQVAVQVATAMAEAAALPVAKKTSFFRRLLSRKRQQQQASSDVVAQHKTKDRSED